MSLSDSETMEEEVKQLMSVALTYGNEDYYSTETQPIEGSSSSNFSSLKNGDVTGVSRRLSRLRDEHGNEYLLQLNGFVHLIKKSDDYQLESPTSGSIYCPNVQRKPLRSLGRLKSFIDLSKHGKHGAAPDQLREFQIKVLDSMQFSGDLISGTTNRYGFVDSTTKIVQSSANSSRSSTSIASSFRTGTVRTSSISSPSQSSVKYEKKSQE